MHIFTSNRGSHVGCHVAREAREGQSESEQIAFRGPSDTLHKSRDMTSGSRARGYLLGLGMTSYHVVWILSGDWVAMVTWSESWTGIGQQPTVAPGRLKTGL